MSVLPPRNTLPIVNRWRCCQCESGGLASSRDAALDALQAHLWASEVCGQGRCGEVHEV